MKVNCKTCISYIFYHQNELKGFCLNKQANPTFKGEESIHPFKIYYKQLLSCSYYKEEK